MSNCDAIIKAVEKVMMMLNMLLANCCASSLDSITLFVNVGTNTLGIDRRIMAYSAAVGSLKATCKLSEVALTPNSEAINKSRANPDILEINTQNATTILDLSIFKTVIIVS